MLHSIGPLAVAPDHVPAATADEALVYIAAVALWLIGVVAIVVRKLRAA